MEHVQIFGELSGEIRKEFNRECETLFLLPSG